jgi:hypothetical protein
MRKALIAFVLQSREHFLHQMPTLREEFICAISGRLINIKIKDVAEREKELTREDEMREGYDDQNPKEYGMRTFIPLSLTDSDEYWHHVATKRFAISTQLGPPTFFLTFTMNPYWHEYQALRRDTGTFVESVINMRYLLDSPCLAHEQMGGDLPLLIDRYEKHHHSNRCRVIDGRCQYAYPQPPAHKTRIRHLRYLFARNPDASDIGPHNPVILAQFRCHHCLEISHSDHAIGYVLKYCTKNSDAGQVGIQSVLYEGHLVRPENKLKYYAATGVASACGCFAGICGFWRYHMKATVRSLGVHLPRKTVILAAYKPEALVKVDIPGPLERYLGRSADQSFDHVRCADYYANYSADSKSSSDLSPRDTCQRSHFANQRRKVILCMLNTVSLMNHELVALRLLLRAFAARSWEDLYRQRLLTSGSSYSA